MHGQKSAQLISIVGLVAAFKTLTSHISAILIREGVVHAPLCEFNLSAQFVLNMNLRTFNFDTGNHLERPTHG
ncbi:hypothetical protein EDD22DRAFT_885292 [Suillus occidentalis]|nr:hypothetical protein EDD22DRAFT_885292 [Suillus occidentalis]